MSVSAINDVNAVVVLVVEDEFFVRCDIASCLRDAGYVVVETDSGEEAMAMCKSDMSIDMVFTDINLVGTASGLDVAECYRMERPDVPVLYTSGKVIDERRRVPRSLFIPKPYRSIEVLDAFQRLRTPAS